MIQQSGKLQSLAHLRTRLMGFLGLRTVLVLLAAVGLPALLAVALDAILALPLSIRVAAPFVLAGVALAVVLSAVWQVRYLSPLRVARSFESRTPQLGTAMTNAVQLSRKKGQSHLQQYLSDEAVAYGAAKARQLPTWPVVKNRVLACGALALVTIGSWVLGPVLFADVFEAVVPRYLDPTGDHPPYSRLKITANTENDRVIYGGQCEITAATEGPQPDKLFLMTETEDGVTQTVMFRRPDRSFFQTLTNVRKPTRFWVTDGRARSHRRAIDIIFTPRIEMVEAALSYPQYTRLGDKRQQLKEPHLQLPASTQVQFNVLSNRPLKHGTVELVPVLGGKTRTIELKPMADNDKLVSGSFAADEAMVFTLSVVDETGLKSNEPRKGRITILPDRRPQIVVLEPDQNAVATPTVSIPVHVRAEDDYGVEQVLWFRGLNQSVERPFRMVKLDSMNPARAESRGSFNLADLGVRPGDRIEYFFEAIDNNPHAPNITTSRIYSLEIISDEQFRDIVQMMAAREDLFEQYAMLSDFLNRLAEQAQVLEDMNEKLAQQAAAGKPPTAAQLQELEAQAAQLAANMAAYQKMLNEAMAQPSAFEIENDFKKHLAEQAEEMEKLKNLLSEMRKQAKEEQKSGKTPTSASPYGGGMLDPQSMAKLVEGLGGAKKDMDENVAAPAEYLASVARLLVKAEEFIQLTHKQKELLQLLNRFKDHEGILSRTQQMELQELAAAQERIRDELRDLLTLLPVLLDQVPDDEEYDELRESTEAFIAAVVQAQIDDELTQSTDALKELDGPVSHPFAQTAYEKMDALIARCNGIGEGAASNCPPVFWPKMSSLQPSSSLAQLMGALKGGSGGGGGHGYGLMGNNMGVYGPNIHIPRQANSGRGNRPNRGQSRENRPNRVASDATDPGLPEAPDAGPVQLRHNARFPLQYRNLVGEYFRAIAESQ